MSNESMDLLAPIVYRDAAGMLEELTGQPSEVRGNFVTAEAFARLKMKCIAMQNVLAVVTAKADMDGEEIVTMMIKAEEALWRSAMDEFVDLMGSANEVPV